MDFLVITFNTQELLNRYLVYSDQQVTLIKFDRCLLEGIFAHRLIEGVDGLNLD